MREVFHFAENAEMLTLLAVLGDVYHFG